MSYTLIAEESIFFHEVSAVIMSLKQENVGFYRKVGKGFSCPEEQVLILRFFINLRLLEIKPLFS